MADNKLNLPGGFGGLMRYDEEYESKFKISPVQVIGYIILVVLFTFFLRVLIPLKTA
jgi:preprotein translocase subunit Sec61beta